MAAKYITFKQNGSNISEIVVFSNTIAHAEMLNSLPHAKEIVGAGFIDFRIGKDPVYLYDCVLAQCYGRSDSIGIESHPSDTQTANRRLVDEE